MSNVKFLRGTQTKLDSLTSFNEGAFYLTSDTDRLYFAQSNNELVYLNKYITKVNTLAELQSMANLNDGDFYYVVKENILCTRITDSDGTVHWVQINASQDTNTDTALEKVTFKSAVSEDKSKITITGTFKQKNTDINSGTAVTNKQPADITASFDITSELIGQITVNTDVDVTVDSVENNSATIKTSGTGSSVSENAGFKISGTGGVTITGNSEEIVINSKEYSLQSAANSTDIQMPIDGAIGNNKVSLTSNATNGSVVINGASAGAIDISHKDYNYNNANELNNQNVTEEVAVPTIKILSGLEVDNGHVTGVKQSEIQLANDRIKSATLNNGSLDIQMAYANGKNSNLISTGDVFYYTIGKNNIPVGANLDELYYTKSEIDADRQALNALSLEGEIAEGQQLPEISVKKGYTYIVTSSHEIKIGEDETGKEKYINAKVGDLFIASGEENAEGYLETIAWIYVPSGDETVYTYTLTSNSTDGIVLTRNDGPTNKIAISNDDAVIVNSTNNELSFSHAKTNPALITKPGSETIDNTNEDASFNAITGITVNDYGHVEKITTTNFSLPNNNHKLSVADNVISLTNVNNVNKGNVTIKGGDNLTASTANDIITISHNTLTPNIITSKIVEIDLTKKEEFTTLNSIDYDDYGHVKEITNLPVNFVTVGKFTHDISSNNNIITIKDTVEKNTGVLMSSKTTELSSESLLFELTSRTDPETKEVIKKITAEIEWGEF